MRVTAQLHPTQQSVLGPEFGLSTGVQDERATKFFRSER
jgi:hypothetical protein